MAPTSIEVRPVRRDDFAAWKPLWDGYNGFYGRAETTALPLEITRLTWSRFFDDYEPVYALVAVDGSSGSLVGLAHFLYHRSTTLANPICYLQDLFTLESVRGRGIGRALIQAVYERAEASGSSRVYWQTHEKLYAEPSFSRTGSFQLGRMKWQV
jgi:GNAT superfamily N-acetyltransferase